MTFRGTFGSSERIHSSDNLLVSCKDATRSVMSKFDIYISRIMPLLYIIRLSIYTAPRHETRALWTRSCPKFPGYVPGAGPGVATPLPACVIEFVTAQGFITLTASAHLAGLSPPQRHYGSSKPVVMLGSKGYSPTFFEHISNRNSSLLCHNCPTH